MSANPETEGLGGALRDAVASEFSETQQTTNPAKALLEEHFGGADPTQLPVASDPYDEFIWLHLQNAVDKFMAEPGRESRVQGLSFPSTWMREEISMSRLLSPPSLSWPGPSLASADYIQREVSDGYKTLLRRGLIITRDEKGPAALWLRASQRAKIVVDVIAPTQERVDEIVQELRASSRELNPFQGQVITITSDCAGNLYPVFLDRPREVGASDVILPGDLLSKIEQQALGASRAKEDLKGANHQLKRGILLYGRPGTGKTHVIRYLIGMMKDYTVLTMPASRMQALTDRITDIIPYVTPGILIFDDVDLIAEGRSYWFTNTDNRGPLFSLLEIMDGIVADTDLLFVLTTNRADRLEDAIAARPGRVDQAFEVPPPDAECRRRLFELYAKNVDTKIDDMDTIVARTAGVTGSFMKEIVRRATVVAAMDDDNDDLTVTDAHVSEALDQLLDPDNEMTAVLLGEEVEAPKPTLGHLAAAMHRH